MATSLYTVTAYDTVTGRVENHLEQNSERVWEMLRNDRYIVRDIKSAGYTSEYKLACLRGE